MKVSIKGARIESHMTQKEVAEKMSIAKETISNWENGKTAPTVPQLIRLCEVYGVRMTDIFLPIKLAKSEKINKEEKIIQ